MSDKTSNRAVLHLLSFAVGIWAVLRANLCASLASMETTIGSAQRDPLIWEWWLWSIVAATSLSVAIVQVKLREFKVENAS